jgi:SAM-dependent methyltransferase
MRNANVTQNAIEPRLSNPRSFNRRDGTVAFYHQVARLVTERSTVLDLGAGRAAWFGDLGTRGDHPRHLRGRVQKVIAVDVDPVVLQNPSADECLVMHSNSIPLSDHSVDVIIADWVLEHIEFPKQFCEEVNRVLRPGGWFCGRTPHSSNYISIAARLIRNRHHAEVLKYVQPHRDAVDVFPTFYRLNTISKFDDVFSGFSNHTFFSALSRATRSAALLFTEPSRPFTLPFLSRSMELSLCS